jgi:hypothetical protein
MTEFVPPIFRFPFSPFRLTYLPSFNLAHGRASHQMTSNPLPSEGEHGPGSVGPGQGVEISIRGDDGKALKTGEKGEVCIVSDLRVMLDKERIFECRGERGGSGIARWNGTEDSIRELIVSVVSTSRLTARCERHQGICQQPQGKQGELLPGGLVQVCADFRPSLLVCS